MTIPISRTLPGSETHRAEGVYVGWFNNGLTARIERVNGDMSVDSFICTRDECRVLQVEFGKQLKSERNHTHG